MTKFFVYSKEDVRRLDSLRFDVMCMPEVDFDAIIRIWGICSLLDNGNETPTVGEEFHNRILSFVKGFLIRLACKAQLETSKKFEGQFQARLFRLRYERNRELYKDLKNKREKFLPTKIPETTFEIFCPREKK